MPNNNRKEFRVDDDESRMMDDLTRWLGVGAYSIWFRQTIRFLHRRASEFVEKYPNVPLDVLTSETDGTWAFMAAYYNAKAKAQTEVNREASAWLREYYEARRISVENIDARQRRAEEALVREARKMWAAGRPIDRAWLSGESRPTLAAPAPAPANLITTPETTMGAPEDLATPELAMLERDEVPQLPAPIADRDDDAGGEDKSLDALTRGIAAIDAARAARRAPSAGALAIGWPVIFWVVVVGVVVLAAGALGAAMLLKPM